MRGEEGKVKGEEGRLFLYTRRSGRVTQPPPQGEKSRGCDAGYHTTSSPLQANGFFACAPAPSRAREAFPEQPGLRAHRTSLQGSRIPDFHRFRLLVSSPVFARHPAPHENHPGLREKIKTEGRAHEWEHPGAVNAFREAFRKIQEEMKK